MTRLRGEAATKSNGASAELEMLRETQALVAKERAELLKELSHEKTQRIDNSAGLQKQLSTARANEHRLANEKRQLAETVNVQKTSILTARRLLYI